MTYIASCLEGIEDICKKEVRGKKIFKGKVEFNKLKENIRSANTIYELITKFKFQNIDEFESKIKKINLNSKEVYKVQCNRKGTHNFNRVDIERLFTRILANKGFKLDLKKAKKIIYIDIIDNFCLIGFLIKDRISRREFRVKIHNHSINACLAFSLLKLIDYKKEDLFLDPLCKDCIIPIEAALMGGKKIHAMDPNKNNIRNSEINMKMAKVKINLSHNEINWLETLYKKNSVDKIASVVFISKRDKKAIDKAKDFLYQIKSIVKDKAGIISNKNIIKDLAKRYFELKEERKINIGKMEYYILILTPKKD